MKDIEELLALYNQTSKHSNYQILPKRLSSILDQEKIKVRTRYEAERLKYIAENISFKNNSVLDIGGNTGYFSFEVIELGAKAVHLIEGNSTHTKFVKKAAEELKLNDKIEISNSYLSFNRELDGKKYDVILLLNVLHHLGDDFGDEKISVKRAKEEILIKMNSLADKTKTLVFQLGFNWKGKIETPLFKNGTKSEMVEYVKKGCSEKWSVVKIGIPENANNTTVYKDLTEKNMIRDDSLGEFLNRPIFILKSKLYSSKC